MFLLLAVLVCQVQKVLCCDGDRGINEITENGEKFIQCDGTKAHNVFINNVRSTDGVNLTTVDSTGQLKVAGCLTGTPDVFNYEGNERTWYCRPGCSPLHGRQWNITYPREIVSLEPSSPPILISSEHSVTISCAPGYAQVFGEKKETTSLCTDNGWSNKESSFITCKRGCPNLEDEIANAIVNTTKTFEVGQVPFRIGDTISIYCNKGYTLVGESPLTCNSLNRWQINEIPKCVKA